ncbi:uncharacterized protein LOC127277925 [Leptopilina boulardi]|uniref:uncharacterized protein LOC127277925 n=1 Tax=Leptopilina boulardi TaxID=63433 RepID=UPI0021F5D98C|nr:uncharacterized protein LOC127277925 [Leptopilina boulardi]
MDSVQEVLPETVESESSQIVAEVSPQEILNASVVQIDSVQEVLPETVESESSLIVAEVSPQNSLDNAETTEGESNNISYNNILQVYTNRFKEHDNFLANLKANLQAALAENAQLKREIVTKNKIIENKNTKIVEIEAMNIKLQHQVVDGMVEVSSLIRGHHADIDGESTAVEIPVGKITSNYRKFHMGRGEFLNIEHYAMAMSNINSNPQFVKNIASSVFDKETLLRSSVTGKKSGRSKNQEIPYSLDKIKLLAIKDTYKYYLRTEKKFSKNDADWEAHSTFNYISRKISDLKGHKCKSK